MPQPHVPRNQPPPEPESQHRFQPPTAPGNQPAEPPDNEPPVEREATATGEPQTGGTGHPAVDAVLRSLANTARLAPADQIGEYEAAHRVLQETLSSIDA
jgi:hypothetical protein